MIGMAAMEKIARRKLEKTSPRKVVDIPAGRKSVVLGVTGSIAAYKSAELGESAGQTRPPSFRGDDT